MLTIFRSSGSNVFIWILMGLLIIGLTGFGLSGAVSGLSQQNVAKVGDQEIPTQNFLLRLDSEINRTSEQIGTRLTMEQARLFGIDQQTLGQLVTLATLDDEAADLELSTGDDSVRRALLASPQFQGLDGSFDEDAYQYSLDRQGLTPANFEGELRKGITREALRSAVLAGVTVPPSVAERLLSFAQEERVITWARMPASALETEPEAPTDAELREAYEADPETYTAPETRSVSYAALTVAELARSIEISDEELQSAYDARAEEFNTPEQRVLDRVVFGTEDEASAALARITEGTATLEEIAGERDLSPEEISLGLRAASQLDSGIRDAIMTADRLGVIGPLATSLGPALFRVNAVIPARTVAFDDARDDLRAALADEEAEATITDLIEPAEDLVAGGATFEELAAETEMSFGTIDISSEVGAGLASDQAFRREAFEAELDQDRDLISLSDGGIAVLRVDAITPPTLRPFEDVREEVLARVTAENRRIALEVQAQALVNGLNDTTPFAAAVVEAGLTPNTSEAFTRGTPLPGLPAGIATEAFGVSVNGTGVFPDGDGVVLFQLDSVQTFDLDGADAAPMIAQATSALTQQRASDVFEAYLTAIQADRSITVNDSLIDQILSQYP